MQIKIREKTQRLMTVTTYAVVKWWTRLKVCFWREQRRSRSRSFRTPPLPSVVYWGVKVLYQYIKVHIATRWTIRHGLMLLWSTDLLNVTEEVTIHRPNVSTLLSGAFFRRSVGGVTCFNGSEKITCLINDQKMIKERRQFWAKNTSLKWEVI